MQQPDPSRTSHYVTDALYRALIANFTDWQRDERAVSDPAERERFRMLLEIEGCAPHEEDTWRGRRARLGEAVVEIGGPVPRCATTTRDPSTGKRDFDTLREIARYRGKRDGKQIDFGVYAHVVRPGRVRVGDAVEIEAE